MDKLKKTAFFAITTAILISSSSLGAKYSGEFLNLGAGGRSLALGGAFTAAGGNALSGYYNPGGLSLIERPQVLFMHSESFGSLLNHDFLSYSRPLKSTEKKAAFGISLYRLGGGGIYVTGKDENDRFYVISEESHADYAGYFSYGRSFSEKFSGGVTAKLIYRDIIDESAFGIGIDVGGHYSLYDWISIGLSVQDATTTLLSYSTGKKEYIIPTVRMGTKTTVSSDNFGAALYMDSETRFEGRDYSAQFSAGSISLDSHLGFEVDYKNLVFGRIGSDVGNLTLGAGLVINGFNIDLAMRNHSELDNTYLVSITFGL